MTQKFKGDTTELKMEAAAGPAFDLTSTALDEYFDGAYDSDPFLLMLYDSGRMPFSDRVPRDTFPAFMRQAVPNFPYTGTFDSYLFILNAVFGDGSLIYFEVLGNGKIHIQVNASSAVAEDAIFRDSSGDSDFADDLGNTIIFYSILGITTEYRLRQLLAEMIPAGLYPVVELAFFSIDRFIVEDLGVDYEVVDHAGNSIVFLTGE
jgi:hypothetical protein